MNKQMVFTHHLEFVRVIKQSLLQQGNAEMFWKELCQICVHQNIYIFIAGVIITTTKSAECSGTYFRGSECSTGNLPVLAICSTAGVPWSCSDIGGTQSGSGLDTVALETPVMSLSF